METEERTTWLRTLRIAFVGGFEVPMGWPREIPSGCPWPILAVAKAACFFVAIVFAIVSAAVFGNIVGILIAIANRINDRSN